MIRKSKTSSQLCKGLTLVEVLAGTALMGTLMASILVACGNFRAQATRAHRRIEACAIADEFMRAWWPRRSELASAGEGQVAGHEGWRWRAKVDQRQTSEGLKTKTLKLEFLAAGEEPAVANLEILLEARDATTQSVYAR